MRVPTTPRLVFPNQEDEKAAYLSSKPPPASEVYLVLTVPLLESFPPSTSIRHIPIVIKTSHVLTAIRFVLPQVSTKPPQHRAEQEKRQDQPVLEPLLWTELATLGKIFLLMPVIWIIVMEF